MPARHTVLPPTFVPELAPEWLARHGDLIDQAWVLARQLTDADFEALVIWQQVERMTKASVGDAGQAGPAFLCHLAEAIGIPRETVRRKLEKLAAQGHVQRCGGGWVVTAAASASFRP